MARIDEYVKKAEFIKSLHKVIVPAMEHIMSVNYEVYKKTTPDGTYFTEFVIVTFKGGAITVRNCTGNSQTANFRSLGALLDGGYYDEVDYYESLPELGWELLDLHQDFQLRVLCAQSIETLEDAMTAFELCASQEDVEKVCAHLSEILGSFEVFYFPEDQGFKVENTFTTSGIDETNIWEFEYRRSLSL